MSAARVGEQLKQARTHLQLSLKQVSQVTKIQSWVLEALEADQLHTTMSPVYVKGFVSTYAKLLRLEPEPLIARLYPPVPVAPERQDAGLRTQDTGPKTQDSGLRIQELTKKFSLRPAPWVLSPSMSFIRQVAVGALGIAAMWALVMINPAQHLKLRLPHREASFSVAKRPTSASNEPTVEIQPTQPLELTIQARRDTWVSVKADGQLLTQQRLEVGSKESWKARRRLEVVIAKPAHVEATLNGQSISPFVMAHQGRLVITHQDIKPLTEPARQVSTAQAQTAQ